MSAQLIQDANAVLREMPMCISGLGMVCSLGTDAITACAAARAGLVRTTEIADYPLWSPVDGDVSGAFVHAVPEVTWGFESEARELRLMTAALKDLEQHGAEIDRLGEVVPSYMLLRDPLRTARCSAWADSDDVRKEMAALLEACDDEPADLVDAQSRLLRAVQFSGLRWRTHVCALDQQGPTGLAALLAASIKRIAAEQSSEALLIAVDSLLDEDTLAWLERTGRLKSAAFPAGLMPGEACVALVVESLANACEHGRAPLMRIQALLHEQDDRPYSEGNSPLGKAVARILLGCQRMRPNDTDPLWILSDQNGEYYRAAEWGHALVAARQQEAAFAEPLLWYPAMSFGDTGAASGAVAIAMAARAYARRYAPARHAVVLSTGDGSERTAIVLSPPETRPQETSRR